MTTAALAPSLDALYRFASSTPSIFSGFLSCPFGFHERWTCTACGREPHIYPGTRRSFKWVGLFILLLFSVAFWALPLTPDVRGWPTLSVFAGILEALACPEGSRRATSLPSPNWPLLPFARQGSRIAGHAASGILWSGANLSLSATEAPQSFCERHDHCEHDHCCNPREAGV
jgi:hypothetical protein